MAAYTGGEVVEHRHREAVRKQTLYKMGADEAGAASYEDTFHRLDVVAAEIVPATSSKISSRATVTLQPG